MAPGNPNSAEAQRMRMSRQGKVKTQAERERLNKDKRVSRARGDAVDYAMKAGVDAETIKAAGIAAANSREEFDDLKLAKAAGKKVVDDYLVDQEREHYREQGRLQQQQQQQQQQRDNAGQIAKFEVKGKDRSFKAEGPADIVELYIKNDLEKSKTELEKEKVKGHYEIEKSENEFFTSLGPNDQSKKEFAQSLLMQRKKKNAAPGTVTVTESETGGLKSDDSSEAVFVVEGGSKAQDASDMEESGAGTGSEIVESEAQGVTVAEEENNDEVQVEFQGLRIVEESEAEEEAPGAGEPGTPSNTSGLETTNLLFSPDSSWYALDDDDLVLLENQEGENIFATSAVENMILAGNRSADTKKIPAAVLRKVVTFCENHRLKPMTKITRPLESPDMSRIVQEPFVRLIDLEIDVGLKPNLFQLIEAANYLGFEPLMDLCCAKIVSIAKWNCDYDEFLAEFLSLAEKEAPRIHQKVQFFLGRS